MRQFPFTQVPNILLDTHLTYLTGAELKVLLVVVRQTIGWQNKRTGKRKERDRLTQSQFLTKTGLSRRVVSKSISSLVKRRLICVTDFEGNMLTNPKQRKGKSYLYYTATVQLVHKRYLNLCTKVTITKEKEVK